MDPMLVLLVTLAVAVALLVVTRPREPYTKPRGMKSVPNAWATYHYYDERGTGDGSDIGSTACASGSPGEKPPHKKWPHLRKLHWTAINPRTFGLSEDGDAFRRSTCGKCIEVRRKNGKRQKFVVVDIKGEKGVDLSQHGFKALGMRDNEYVRATPVKC